MTRLSQTFDRLKSEGRTAFVPFIMAGDPNAETTEKLLHALPEAGADVIELGFPFTDPMADGPIIAEAGQRALALGQTLQGTLSMVKRFREAGHETPIVLMGYANPVLQHGESFASDAVEAGADGLILVDLPPEESETLDAQAKKAGLDVIRLATPTTRDERIDRVVERASGFLYYVAVAGVTGDRSAGADELGEAIARLRTKTSLPIAAGFGIKDAASARAAAQHADAVVVGSAIVKTLAVEGPDAALELARDIAAATHGMGEGS
ncbi:tryptophan synthase subunit alpha [Parvularcula sp. ZS-1/3]|uniref:Tryptophan synthase alpha chain n=1 Tax=Parvularcula mediterranea TaxID=2732508 RepID=A0A7Y3W519_9PROT|nr:tryptophan synthase subunit alpha [Parvularcula mediterranea]